MCLYNTIRPTMLKVVDEYPFTIVNPGDEAGLIARMRANPKNAEHKDIIDALECIFKGEQP